jgi:hypothetical protein
MSMKTDKMNDKATKNASPDAKAEYVLRDQIQKLLSDDENAAVAIAETKTSLADGDEYLDLEHLEQGVLHARGHATPMGRVLPRKAVQKDTWTKIVAQLG